MAGYASHIDVDHGNVSVVTVFRTVPARVEESPPSVDSLVIGRKTGGTIAGTTTCLD